MYSEKLIKEVKECYPDDKGIQHLANTGNVWLGRHLNDSCGYGIQPEEILKSSTLEEIKNKARLEKRKINLYRMWKEERYGNSLQHNSPPPPHLKQ